VDNSKPVDNRLTGPGKPRYDFGPERPSWAHNTDGGSYGGAPDSWRLGAGQRIPRASAATAGPPPRPTPTSRPRTRPGSPTPPWTAVPLRRHERASTTSPCPGTTGPDTRGSRPSTVDGQSSGNASEKAGGAPSSTRSPANTTSASGTDTTMSLSVCPRPRCRSDTSRDPSCTEVEEVKTRDGGTISTEFLLRIGLPHHGALQFGRTARWMLRHSSWPQISAGRNTELPNTWSKWALVFHDDPRQRGHRTDRGHQRAPLAMVGPGVDHQAEHVTQHQAHVQVEGCVPPHEHAVTDLPPGLRHDDNPKLAPCASTSDRTTRVTS